MVEHHITVHHVTIDVDNHITIHDTAVVAATIDVTACQTAIHIVIVSNTRIRRGGNLRTCSLVDGVPYQVRLVAVPAFGLYQQAVEVQFDLVTIGIGIVNQSTGIECIIV